VHRPIVTMNIRSRFLFLMACCIAGCAPGAHAADETARHAMTWTTLGTAGGPVIHADRSQPANLLSAGQEQWLVDCGDGALERLAAVGDQPARIHTVFISHLHLDHIAGLQGLIGLRWMQSAPGVLTIYGPPGTDAVVDGIVASLQPSAHIGMAVRGGRSQPGPAQSVKVVIVRDGADLTVDGIRVRAVRNSHFDDAPGHSSDTATESLSYRFDADGYAIGYTGDTGVSQPVADLFRGVNLVVSEVIDLAGTIANINGPHSPMPPQVRPALIEHLKTQHLTPQQAGALAAAAGAQRLVLTHLGIAGPTDRVAPVLVSGAHETFGGQVSVAHDLDRF
jgi:ribonuclease BN (tRNA processing enzyme)